MLVMRGRRPPPNSELGLGINGIAVERAKCQPRATLTFFSKMNLALATSSNVRLS